MMMRVMIFVMMMIIVASASRGHHLGLWTLCGQRTARVVWVFSNTLFTIHNTIEDYLCVFSRLDLIFCEYFQTLSIQYTIQLIIIVGYFQTLPIQYTIHRKVGDHLWNYLWKRLCRVLHTMILQILLRLISYKTLTMIVVSKWGFYVSDTRNWEKDLTYRPNNTARVWDKMLIYQDKFSLCCS